MRTCDRLVVAGVKEATELDCVEHRIGELDHVHDSESLTVIHGSRLSAPFAPDKVSTTAMPWWKNS
jgi:hypothetical protein